MGRLRFPLVYLTQLFQRFYLPHIYIHYSVLGDLPERLPFPLTTATQRKDLV